MPAVWTVDDPGPMPRRKKKAKKKRARRARNRNFTCELGDTKRVSAAPKRKGCTQVIECTHRGATGWTIKKGTRRCSR